MRSIVLSFLLLSARGAVAAAAVWCVCRALRRAHAPSRLLCWLWLAVGVRFVLPWGIPLRLPRPQSAPLAAAADTVQELGALPLPDLAPAAPAAAVALPWYARLTLWHVLTAVWLSGVLVLALRGLAGYWRLRRSVALACRAPDGPVWLHRSRWASCTPASICRTVCGARPGRPCCCMSRPTSAAVTR